MKPRERTDGAKRRRDRDEGELPPLQKKGAKYLEGVKQIDLSLIHISEPTRPY